MMRPLALLIVLAAAAAAQSAAAQSFSCRLAHYPDEFLICRDPGLARLDERLAAVYDSESRKLSDADRRDFEQHETLFVNARHRCGVDAHCIAQSYINRIQELQNLLSENDEAEPARGSVAPPSQPTEQRASRNPVPESRNDKAAELGSPAPRGAKPRQSTGAETGSASEAPAQPEMTTPRPEHQAKRRSPPAHAAVPATPESETIAHAAGTTPAPAAPPAAASGSTAPAIRWVDPPPAR